MHGIIRASSANVQQHGVNFFFFLKEEIKKVCPQLLKLGLLSEVGISTAGVRKQKRYVSFHNKSLQEFSCSKHIVKKLEKSRNVKVHVQVGSG